MEHPGSRVQNGVLAGDFFILKYLNVFFMSHRYLFHNQSQPQKSPWGLSKTRFKSAYSLSSVNHSEELVQTSPKLASDPWFQSKTIHQCVSLLHLESVPCTYTLVIQQDSLDWCQACGRYPSELPKGYGGIQGGRPIYPPATNPAVRC